MTGRRLEADYGGIRHILAADEGCYCALRMDMEPLPRRRTWPWVLLATVGVVLVAVVAYGVGRWL